MKRIDSALLDDWLADPQRRPLVLRGARQVGKTWLVRDLATRSDLDLIELNFERDPQLQRHFASNDPTTIIGELSLARGRPIDPTRCLLFLDEIQAAGHLLAKLRWFFEEMPALPVVAAGSLLEFTLQDHAFSMPVGRIAFRHVEPMTFDEFLHAHAQQHLMETLQAWRPDDELSVAAHEAASAWFHRYLMVGGMPAVIAMDVAGRTPRACRDEQKEIIATYRADFAKYSGRMNRDILGHVLSAVAGSLGRKFVYARVGQGIKQHQAKRALEQLADARLCHLVPHSAANGLPLASEAKNRLRKAVLVDVGLLHGLLDTPAAEIFPTWGQLPPSLRGQLADQLAAQQLRSQGNRAGDGPQIYYWQREGGRSGEIDFLIQAANRIVPVEIKAGAAGAMKSLHQFVHDKRLDLAVRCDLNPPSVMQVDVKTTQGNPVNYLLLSLPPYLLGHVVELLGEM